MMITRYSINYDNAEYVPYDILDGNITLHEPKQQQYLDGSAPLLQDLVKTSQDIYQDIFKMFHNPAEYILDGNTALFTTSLFPTFNGDGNLAITDGDAPGSIVPFNYKTGDMFQGKYAFRLASALVFDDETYFNFGPDVTYKTVKDCQDKFYNSVGNYITGYVDPAQATPYVVLDIRPRAAFKGSNVRQITDTLFEDDRGFTENVIAIGSSYSNGNGNVDPNDYDIIVYDKDSPYFLTNYFPLETFDGDYVTLAREEEQLKGTVLYNGEWKWCTLDYHSYHKYIISSMIQGEENKTLNVRKEYRRN